MKQSYQHGYLRRTKRKNGPDKWEFLWREIDDRGDRIRRTAIIGDIEQYPTEEAVLAAVNGFRMQINANLYRRPLRVISIGELIDHYVHTELFSETAWHSVATRKIYRYFIEKWIRPRWGGYVLALSAH
jgi:hypothetical protein